MTESPDWNLLYQEGLWRLHRDLKDMGVTPYREVPLPESLKPQPEQVAA